MNILQTRFRLFLVAVQISLSALISIVAVQAAAADLDPTFNGAGFVQPGGSAARTILQPDGKIIVGGTFEIVNGSVKDDLARLNADGTIDESFNAPKIFQSVTAIGLQPDGKILVAGLTTPAAGLTTPMVRLNADGTLDDSFAPPFQFGGQASGAIFDLEILSSGKILIGGSFSYVFNNQTKARIARLNADGSTDNAFLAAGNYQPVNDLAVQPDGKILGAAVAGNGLDVFQRRLNADGTEDAAFTALTSGTVFSYKIQPDGKILLGGNFTAVNNFTARYAARLNPDGAFDPTFAAALTGTNGFVRKIEIGGDGKIFISGRIPNGVRRLNQDGSTDTTFASTLGSFETDIVIQPDGKIIGGGLRLNADGTLDQTFNALLGGRGTVVDIARQSDGKIVAAGVFGRVGSLSRTSLTRLNADGTPDATFTSSITSNVAPLIRAIAVQPDNKILVGGQFFFGPIRRLNSDGSADATFAPPASLGVVYDIVVQPDGKILASGGISINSGGGGCVVRYNADGSRDTSFVNNSMCASAYQMTLQPDGKIIIGGDFINVSGNVRNRIARLNADGTVDTTFNPLGGANAYVAAVGRQSDGKIIIGGAFTTVNGVSKSYIARLNADGSLDQTFTTATNSTVLGIKVQPDDKIIIGGAFGTVNNVAGAGFRRLNADGTIDATFDVGAGTNGAVYAFEIQPDNKILVGGNFTRYKNTSHLSIFRLTNEAAPRRAKFDFDGDGRADVAVFRPANGSWYILPSRTNSFYGFPFGQAGDQIAPADYDGDGKTDVAVFRDTVPGAGNFAYFYILNSADNSFRPVQFGATADVPVSGDWDGDGKADVAVYRNGATNGQSFFYYRPSAQPTVDFVTIQLGTGGDKPVPADYDGDGRLDPAAFQPSSATWLILRSGSNTITRTFFGLGTDIPVPADYDGDGLANLAVFRPSNGTWYTSQNPANNFGAIQFGANGDLPIAADYDGDGRADVAVFRPSNGAWYLNRTTSGFTGVQFGANGDKPAPNAFIR